MEQVVIVACGRLKVWRDKPDMGPVCAREAYVSTLAQLSMRYAELLGHPWYILSAKYGLIGPDFIIEGPYEVTFMDESTRPIGSEVLAAQVRVLGFDRLDSIICLAGPEYYLVLRIGLSWAGVFVKMECPMKRLRIGQRNQWLKRQIEKQQHLLDGSGVL